VKGRKMKKSVPLEKIIPVETNDSVTSNIRHVVTHTANWLLPNKHYVYINPRFNFNRNSNKTVMYFIHGTADRTGAFNEIVKQLIADLPDNIYALKIPSFGNNLIDPGIDGYTEKLINIIKDNADTHIIGVGHSRGALIIASCAAYFADKKKSEPNLVLPEFEAIIPIGGPFEGSQVARVFPISRSVRQMRPGSHILNKISDEVEQSTIPHYPIIAEDDLLVSPLSASLSDFDNPNIQPARMLKGQRHLSMMSSPELVNCLKQILEKLKGNNRIVIPENMVLKDIADKISDEIIRLQSTLHLSSPIAKIQILTYLLLTVEKLSVAPNLETEMTFKEILSQFLNDENVIEQLALPENKTPMKILKEKRNALGITESLSERFIKALENDFGAFKLAELCEQGFERDQRFSAAR
jgi:pimeloyl-ACP methyl ester carboxylesterase